jgi:sugar phosphate isomerase/epimerase
MINFSGFADEVHVDFGQQVEFFHSIGLNYIELRFLDGVNILDVSKEKLTEVKQMLTDRGMGISAIASPIGKYGIDQPFAPHFDKFKHAVDIASFLGTKLIRVFSYYAPKGEDICRYRDEVMERMHAKAEYLKGGSIKMVHENESHIFGYSAENCADIARTINSEYLSLAYDPANFVWGSGIENNVETCWPLMKPYVTHVHIKDWKLGSTDVGSLPGEGDGQIELLIKELATSHYSGFVTLEPHMSSGGQFGGETTPEQMKAALKNVKTFCDKYGIVCA